MILVPQFQLAFIHIPKTGGTSIAHVLNRFSARGARSDPYATHEGGIDGIHHRPGIECELPRGWEAIAVVRHPADRLSSMFRHHGNPPEGFAAWCRWLSNYDSVNPFYAPQVAFLSGVTTLLRFEHLAEDWAALTGRVFGEALELPHENRAKAPDEGIDRELAIYWAQQVWPEDCSGEIGYF